MIQLRQKDFIAKPVDTIIKNTYILHFEATQSWGSEKMFLTFDSNFSGLCDECEHLVWCFKCLVGINVLEVQDPSLHVDWEHLETAWCIIVSVDE